MTGARFAPFLRRRAAHRGDLMPCVAVLGALLLTAPVWGRTPDVAEPIPGLAVEITRLNGDSLRAGLLSAGPRLVLRTEDGATLALGWDEVLSVAPQDPAQSPPAEPPPWRLLLTDGAEFTARLGPTETDSIQVTLAWDMPLRVPREALRVLVASRPPAAARERVAAWLAPDGDAPAAEEDQAIIGRGAEVMELRGVIRALDAAHVRFEWNGRETAIPWERLIGLRWGRRTPRGASALVRLHGGDTLAGRIATGDDTQFTLESGLFGAVSLPWKQVERIDSLSEKLVFLSDLTPRRYEFQPLFEKRWPLGRDRTLYGQPLRLGGRTYARGIALHSSVQVTYALQRQFSEFAAVVGIADEMGLHGDADVSILGDGRELWSARNLRGGAEPRTVSISVRGVRELTLVVDYGADLDLGDQVIWAFARLIRP